MGRMGTYDLVIIALLSALAGIFQVTHGVLGIPTGFGMTVDLVAVPVLLAFFVFGFEHAVWVLVLTTVIITVIAPTSWLGASMKFAGTLPMIAVPAFYLVTTKRKTHFALFSAAIAAACLAALILSWQANLSIQPSLPDTDSLTASLFLGLAPIAILALFSAGLLYLWKTQAVKVNPAHMKNIAIVGVVLLVALAVRGAVTVVSNYYYAAPLFWGMSPEKMMGMVPWYLIIGWNSLQGLLEFCAAWVVAYTFGFSEKYGKWAK